MSSENGGASENVRAAALTHSGGYSITKPCHNERQFWGSHSGTRVSSGAWTILSHSLRRGSSGHEAKLRLSLSFPGPTSALPTSIARGSYASIVLRLNQMRGRVKHCWQLWFGDVVMALLK
tara:strand:+ start:486 stop:848 length:363 start_codon:yes stop_codon:yes gene_type:complete